MALALYARNVHSQHGEDGIIGELLDRLSGRIGRGRNWAFECGAWDGVHLSNTYNLAEERGFTVVAVEGDSERYSALVATARRVGEVPDSGGERGRIVPVNRWLSASEDTIGDVLRAAGAPRDLALMSIDIDGADYQVWENLSDDFRPAIVVIEIDSSVPPGTAGVHGDGREMTTFTSMLDLGRRKGYSLVAHTGNMIFVHDDLVGRLGLPGITFKDPARLFDWGHVVMDDPVVASGEPGKQA